MSDLNEDLAEAGTSEREDAEGSQERSEEVSASGGERHGIDRREFLASSAKLGIAAAVAPTIWVPRYHGQSKSLTIMQWSHFVPSYDDWFDKWAQDWGQKNGVDVTVDHIALSNLGTRANAEVSAQSGHDLFQFLSPPGAFEPHVLDMADTVQEAQSRFGPILELGKHSTYNPVTDKWFGFTDNYVPDPGDYLKSVWSDVGMPNGPSHWEDLVKAGPQIHQKHPEIQIPIGLGMSQELDSNMAARAVLWSFGGSVQDENENVVLDSDATRQAIDFMSRLYKAGMNKSVLSWNAASNNQALNARATSYILNSISAYRTAQSNDLPVADDISFVPALKGPNGDQWASEHVMGVYVIWKFAKSPDLAKKFLMDLLGTYQDAVKASKLYNFPSFPGTVAQSSVPVSQKPDAGAKWLKQVTGNDPFGSKPADKLAPIGTALDWSTNQGHPGPANPATGEVFDTFVLPTMFAKAATGQASAEDALKEAVSRTKQIYAKWRKQGLVGGGSNDR